MATVMPITIAIADDHEFTRHMLIRCLSDDSAITVTIEASNGEELIEKLQTAATIPEICILDISMPVKNGHETMDVLRLRWPKLKVLVFTIHSHEFAVINMLKKGACGYVMKSAHPSDLFTAIRHIHEHGFFNSEIMNSQAVRMREAPDLNEKEIDFLKHICDDIPYKEIAQRMNTTTRTIEMHRDKLLAKLNLKTRLGLAQFALQTGLVFA